LFDLRAVRAWLKQRDAAMERLGVKDLDEARALRYRAQARLAEQAVQIRQGNLLPRETVERQWSAQIAAVKTRLLALPVTHADRIHRAQVAGGRGGVLATVNEAIFEVLRELDGHGSGRPASA
jgi:hypothetical protein